MKIKRIVLVSAIVLAAPCTAHATTINGICYGNRSPSIPEGTFDPNDPSASGYSLVFDSEFNNFNDFDLTCNAAPTNGGCQNPQGKNWYLDGWTFFPNNTTNATKDLAISSGILSIHQSIRTGNWAISTMAPNTTASHGPAAWQQRWNGEVFGGGWYAEARLSQEFKDNTTGQVVTNPGARNGHASFWAYAVDHYTGDQHFMENDMIDGEQGTAYYQTNLIDWTGNNPINTPGTGMNQYDQVNVTQFGFPGNTFMDRTSLHIFGQRWVPATATTQGYLQNYLDGVPTSRFNWDKYNPSAPQPPTGAQIASILDQNHMHIILGADPPLPGETSTATEFVDWVHVWQLPAARTASGNTVIPPQVNFTGGNGSCNNAPPPPPPPPTGGLPDLIGTSISYVGGNFTSVVSNQGNVATPSGVTIGVAYLVDGVKQTWGFTNTPLAPGASATISTQGGIYTIPNGTHTITVVADDVNRMTESNKNNNSLSKTITIGSLSLPDLISTSVSWASGNFTSIVKNQGNAATPAGVVIGVAYNVGGVKCTWGAVPGPLAAGASVTIGTGGGACPVSTGTRTIAVVADDANRITESNKNNNTLSQTIQVP